MLIKKAINEKFLKVLFAGFISYCFGLIILQYNFKAVVVLGLAIFVIVFLTRIEYAFYFLLATRSIIDIFYGVELAGNIRITHLIGVLLILLFLYYIIVVSRFNIFSLDINKIYGIFLFFSIPSIFFTEPLVAGLGAWFRLFQGLLILNITILIVLNAGSEFYKKRVNIICWSIIIALFLPCILFFKNYIAGVYFVRQEVPRYALFGAYPNVFSYILLAVFPFCLFLYTVSVRKSKKILWLIFMAIIISTIYITNTRNVWVGLVILLITWNVLRKNFKTTLSVIGIVVLMIIFNHGVQDRLSDLYMLLTSGKGFFTLDPKLLSHRIAIWQANLDYFINQSTLVEKLFGSGFDISSKIATLRGEDRAGEHNNYLTLLMTTGIFGLSFYLLYILKFFQESFKLFRRTKEIYLRNLAIVLISLLFVYVTISGATHILWNITFQYYFSVFAGFVIAANILEKRNEIMSKNKI